MPVFIRLRNPIGKDAGDGAVAVHEAFRMSAGD